MHRTDKSSVRRQDAVTTRRRPKRDQYNRRELVVKAASLGLADGGASFLAACGGKGATTTARHAEVLGGSGVADRAVEGARELGGSLELSLIYPSGAAADFVPFLEEWGRQAGHSFKGTEIPIAQ